MDDGNTVRNKIKNPYTNKNMNEIAIKYYDGTIEYFQWNRYWHVYNSKLDYSQLKEKDLRNLYIEKMQKMFNFDIGDIVKVVKNNCEPEFDALVGKIATISDVLYEEYEIVFDNSENWNWGFFYATEDELEKVEI